MSGYRRAAAAGAVVLALSGCSGAAGAVSTSAPDPAYLLAQATANAKAATAVHIRGTGSCPEGQFVVDMDLRSDDTAAGSVTFQGATIDVVATKAQLLLHAPQTFWATQSSAKVAARIGGKWLRISRATNPCIDALTSIPHVTANYFGYAGTPTLQAGSSFKGTPAAQVGLGSDVAYWIATQGTLLPLNVHDATSQTDIAMTGWGSDPTVVVPPSTDVIDAVAADKP